MPFHCEMVLFRNTKTHNQLISFCLFPPLLPLHFHPPPTPRCLKHKCLFQLMVLSNFYSHFSWSTPVKGAFWQNTLRSIIKHSHICPPIFRVSHLQLLEALDHLTAVVKTWKLISMGLLDGNPLSLKSFSVSLDQIPLTLVLALTSAWGSVLDRAFVFLLFSPALLLYLGLYHVSRSELSPSSRVEQCSLKYTGSVFPVWPDFNFFSHKKLQISSHNAHRSTLTAMLSACPCCSHKEGAECLPPCSNFISTSMYKIISWVMAEPHPQPCPWLMATCSSCSTDAPPPGLRPMHSMCKLFRHPTIPTSCKLLLKMVKVSNGDHH